MLDSVPLDRFPCISMIAYTGRKMKVGGISLPIVVDLRGLEIPKQNLALLLNHERLYRNPLDSLTILNTRTDRRHDRRLLAMDEFVRMYEAAKTGPPVEGISGHDRAMLYLLAASPATF